MSQEYYDKERYKAYLEDVDIAIGEMRAMKLYPVSGKIVCDLYFLPSVGASTYYTIIYETAGGYDMVYAKPQVYEPIVHEWVTKWRFKDAKETENHPAKDGKIILGIKHLPDVLMDEIREVPKHLSTVRRPEVGVVLDGCFQAIRRYKDAAVCDEVVFHSEDILVMSDGKEYPADKLERVFAEVGELIG